MGWTSYHATHYKNGKVDRKAEVDKMFTQSEHDYEYDEKVTHLPELKVLKSRMVGSVYYGAVQINNNKENTSETVGIVCLTSVDTKDYFNFSYKDMSETSGPCYYDCPKSILDLLTPTDSEWANEWRKRCYEEVENKKTHDLSKLPIGTKIKFFMYGNDKEVVAVKRAPAYQFKTPFWYIPEDYGYIQKKHIPKDFEIVKEVIK